MHVVDTATFETERDPVGDLEVIEAELLAFDPALADRPRLVALNKIDIPDGREMAAMVSDQLREQTTGSRNLRGQPRRAARTQLCDVAPGPCRSRATTG